MTTTTINRRAALAGALAALPGLACGALAAPVADPVFAAIERHRGAWRRFEATCPLVDEVLAESEGRTVTAADEAEYEAANDAETVLLLALLSTAPQTRAGARALLEYLSRCMCGFDLAAIDDALAIWAAEVKRKMH